MGKALVIKGVNYSANSIQTDIQRLSWIGLSDQDATFENSPNGRYISSGVTFNTDVRLSVTFKTDTEKHSMRLPGTRFSTNATVHAWVQPGAVQVFFGSYGLSPNINLIQRNLDIWDGGIHTIDISRLRATIDDHSILWDHEINPMESSSVPLFLDCASIGDEKINTYAQALYNEEISPLPEVVKIQNVKIWTDCESEETLIIDAVPAMRLSDGAVGFYNLINGEFLLRNDGSTPSYGMV